MLLFVLLICLFLLHHFLQDLNQLWSYYTTKILKSFHPVSNLTYLSKLIEKVIAIGLVEHMRQNAIMEKFQSAYEAHHSTETALLRVYNDVCHV